jgi:hypothetical protein
MWRWENLPEELTISAALHQSGLYGRVARQNPLLSKRHMTARAGVSQKAPKRTMKTRSSGLMKPILNFGLNGKCQVWRKPDTIPMVKHGGGSIML